VSTKSVLEHERANLVDQIAEYESERKEWEPIEREQRVCLGGDYGWLSPEEAEKRRRNAQIALDRALLEIANLQERIRLRRRWLKGIEKSLDRLPS
jgi:hypothetical protein